MGFCPRSGVCTENGFDMQCKVQQPALVHGVRDNVSQKPGLIHGGILFGSLEK